MELLLLWLNSNAIINPFINVNSFITLQTINLP